MIEQTKTNAYRFIYIGDRTNDRSFIFWHEVARAPFRVGDAEIFCSPKQFYELTTEHDVRHRSDFSEMMYRLIPDWYHEGFDNHEDYFLSLLEAPDMDFPQMDYILADTGEG